MSTIRDAKAGLRETRDFSRIQSEVLAEKASNVNYYVKSEKDIDKYKLNDIYSYSGNGITSLGNQLQFPMTARVVGFIKKHKFFGPKLLKKLFKDKFDYMSKTNGRGAKKLFIREFFGQKYAVLTEKYSIFDDDEVCEILEKSEHLMKNTEKIQYDVSPERFHARFISKNKLEIEGDKSPLSMAVFVTNSMTGNSSFQIKFGVFRWACTNGLIMGFDGLEIVKELHKGTKDYVSIVESALTKTEEIEKMITENVKILMEKDSRIAKLSEDEAIFYLKSKLQLSVGEGKEVYELFKEYGGKTKWDLINAITDIAHKYNTEKRLFLETVAMKVA